MKLGVGAVSRRVVEEAARLRVPQIVASRAQVNEHGGYVGLDQTDLVGLVRDLSDGLTQVVRDHGGPLQGGFRDDGISSLRADIRAGFDGLHIDVCKLPSADQASTLVELVERFADDDVAIEIGGEHEDQVWNDVLLEAVLKNTEVKPSYAVIETGSHVWADSQVGDLKYLSQLDDTVVYWRGLGIGVKAHNMDWVGARVRRYGKHLDAYNIAPEFARVETDAILAVLDDDDAHELLNRAYALGAWRRWFNDDEGTWFDRARCAVHYVQETRDLRGCIRLDEDRDGFVRRVIRDAISAG